MNFLNRLIACIVIVVFISSCNLYPDDGARVDELDLVATYNDRSLDFSDFKTYTIIDSLADLVPNPSQLNDDNPLGKYEDLILDLINTNMKSRGYQEIDNIDSADLAINVGVLMVSNVVVGPYPPYYWGCPPGWCYPWYPWYPIGVVGQYDVGTLIIDMIDSQNYDSDTTIRIPTVWTSITNGLANVGTDAETRSRIKFSINQSFEQSPYIQTN